MKPAEECVFESVCGDRGGWEKNLFSHSIVRVSADVIKHTIPFYFKCYGHSRNEFFQSLNFVICAAHQDVAARGTVSSFWSKFEIPSTLVKNKHLGNCTSKHFIALYCLAVCHSPYKHSSAMEAERLLRQKQKWDFCNGLYLKPN